MIDQAYYLNDDVRTACGELLPTVDKFHISPQTYTELEQATFIPVNINHVGKGRGAFAIVVDGATWFPLEDDRTVLGRTEYLLFDARTDVWKFYERAVIRRAGCPDHRQVVGALWHLPKNAYTSMVSDSIAVMTERGIRPWQLDEPQARRMIRVAIGLLWLLKHDRVQIVDVPADGKQHYLVSLPSDLTAGRALRELLDGKHIRKSKPFIVGLWNAVQRILQRGHE